MGLEENLSKKIVEQISQKTIEQQLDEEQIKELISVAVKAVTTDGLESASNFLLDTLKQQVPEMLTQEHRFQAEFEQRLQDRWKKAFDLYDIIIILGRECGELFVKQYRTQAAKDQDLVFEVLMRVHVKACQTALAVGVLLKSGYARDAHARQRTLHELSVTALFIKKHGQETAQCYWQHNIIESYKAALQYELYCKRLGYDPSSPANLDSLRLQRDALTNQFGTVFNEQYGWAAMALGKLRGISFADIERDVQLDHLRPYYRMASYGIHANSKGLFFDVGNIYKERPGYSKTLLAGASNAGLADPGQLALLSFNQCTAAFLTLKSDLETLMKLKVLSSFVDEAGQAFIEIHQNL